MVSTMKRMNSMISIRRNGRTGFTLIETMIAIAILSIGILGLGAMLADCLAYMSMSQYDYLAQQKAAAAVESIFTARDMGQITWSSVCNVGSAVCSGGIFINGPQPLCDPGADGIVGTADDFGGGGCAVQQDAIILLNGAGTFTSGAASRVPLSNFQFLRAIAITSIPNVANLRQIQVTITYAAGRFKRTYSLTTNISNFS
jgi:prepilin-type N-terminal cleavage/methylation domain-containing protein